MSRVQIAIHTPEWSGPVVLRVEERIALTIARLAAWRMRGQAKIAVFIDDVLAWYADVEPITDPTWQPKRDGAGSASVVEGDTAYFLGPFGATGSRPAAIH